MMDAETIKALLIKLKPDLLRKYPIIDLAHELEEKLHRRVDLVSAGGLKKKYLVAIQPEIVYV